MKPLSIGMRALLRYGTYCDEQGRHSHAQKEFAVLLWQERGKQVLSSASAARDSYSCAEAGGPGMAVP